MNILFLTYNFEPDLGACSTRNTPLFRELSSALGKGDYIHVITSAPNRYGSFKVTGEAVERGENYRIDRIGVREHGSGMLERGRAYSVYYRGVMRLIRKERFDLVYASSSHLITAFLGKRCAVRKRCPLYVDVRDIFLDTLTDVFGRKKYLLYPLIPGLKLMERYTFARAEHINLISGGFREYFARYGRPAYTYFTHGIDRMFIDAGREPSSVPEKPYIITYAGNIGSGQGLERIIPEAAVALGPDYRFRIIGDGGRKAALEARLRELNVKNVDLLAPVPRKELPALYRESTFLFFHLNDLDAFKKVLPSKMFEYGAFDKPIIAGVVGYAREFVEKNLPEHILFAPLDTEEFIRRMRSYTLRFELRDEFRRNFSRESIDRRMVESILAAAR